MTSINRFQTCNHRLLSSLLSVSLGLFCGASHAATTGNLVVNGDAETGDLTGWLTASDMNVISDPGAANRGTLGLSSDVGDYSFHGGTGPSPATATQTIDLTSFGSDIDAGDQFFRLGVALQSRAGGTAVDLAIARFTFMDAADSDIGSSVEFTDAAFPVGDFTWTEFSAQGFVPVGARTLGIEIESNRNGGVSSSSFIDNVFFVLGLESLPGDGNGDGWVDGLDYLLWAGAFATHPGADGDISDGDYNDDGWVDGLDYLLWAGNFGTHATTAVPEPGTLGVALIGLLSLLGAARRRRR